MRRDKKEKAGRGEERNILVFDLILFLLRIRKRMEIDFKSLRRHPLPYYLHTFRTNLMILSCNCHDIVMQQ